MSEGCNVDDILCQIEALRSMRSLRTALGNETFASEFPELEGFDTKLTERIETTRGDLKTALAQCGNVDLADVELTDFDGEDDEEEED